MCYLFVRRSSAAGAGRLPVWAANRCLPHCSHPIHLLLAGKPYVGCRSQGDCCLHLRYTCVRLAGKPYLGYRSRRAQQIASCTFVSSCLLLAGKPHIGCPSRQIFHNDMIYPKPFRLTLLLAYTVCIAFSLPYMRRRFPSIKCVRQPLISKYR
jgi:hypothetical protein